MGSSKEVPSFFKASTFEFGTCYHSYHLYLIELKLSWTSKIPVPKGPPFFKHCTPESTTRRVQFCFCCLEWHEGFHWFTCSYNKRISLAKHANHVSLFKTFTNIARQTLNGNHVLQDHWTNRNQATRPFRQRQRSRNTQRDKETRSETRETSAKAPGTHSRN